SCEKLGRFDAFSDLCHPSLVRAVRGVRRNPGTTEISRIQARSASAGIREPVSPRSRRLRFGLVWLYRRQKTFVAPPSAAAGNVQQFAEAIEDLELEGDELRLIEPPAANEFECQFARGFQRGLIADQIGDLKRKVAVLTSAENVSRPAQAKICFGHVES